LLKKWIQGTLDPYKIRAGDITIVACSDAYLLKANREFLKHDYYTDIITFDYSSDTFISGDLLISIERVRENASRFSLSFKDELNRVIIHGVLHLLGYKDKVKQDKLAMTDAENKALLRFNELIISQ
jgi:probable rRNA maturation factor